MRSSVLAYLVLLAFTGSGRQDGKFHEIMVVVERAPVEIYDLVVTFGNSERYEPNLRSRASMPCSR